MSARSCRFDCCLILIRPRLGLALSAIVMVMGVLMDRSRLHPHYVLWFLMLATLPGANAQLVGRANLISLWFWAGFHKLILDFIKPHRFSRLYDRRDSGRPD